MTMTVLGYLASVLIIGSLLMKDIKKLRYVNLVGCSIYVFYGVVIQAWPIFFMNLICVGINLYRINSLAKEKN
ncbi:uroporphyrinogen decarboxylase [Aliivibrio wodanis]|uniref:uroporphyrinogen decarboxylase n=1 Tax=Aliivibrio wodanis TaxID=80852 RepID=UPI00406C0812